MLYWCLPFLYQSLHGGNTKSFLGLWNNLLNRHMYLSSWIWRNCTTGHWILKLGNLHFTVIQEQNHRIIHTGSDLLEMYYPASLLKPRRVASVVCKVRMFNSCFGLYLYTNTIATWLKTLLLLKILRGLVLE